VKLTPDEVQQMISTIEGLMQLTEDAEMYTCKYWLEQARNHARNYQEQRVRDAADEEEYRKIVQWLMTVPDDVLRTRWETAISLGLDFYTGLSRQYLEHVGVRDPDQFVLKFVRIVVKKTLFTRAYVSRRRPEYLPVNFTPKEGDR